MESKLTYKGQVSIPKALRDALGLKAGDRVVFEIGEGHFVGRVKRGADGAPPQEAPPKAG